MSTDMEDPNQMDPQACAGIIALSYSCRHSLHHMPDRRSDIKRPFGLSLGDLLDIYRSDDGPHFDCGDSLSFVIRRASCQQRPAQVFGHRETIYTGKASHETLVHDRLAAIKVDRR